MPSSASLVPRSWVRGYMPRYLLSLLLSGKSTSNTEIEVIYDEPDDFRRSTANARDIELKDCPAYVKVQQDTHVELEHCPAYGKL